MTPAEPLHHSLAEGARAVTRISRPHGSNHGTAAKRRWRQGMPPAVRACTPAVTSSDATGDAKPSCRNPLHRCLALGGHSRQGKPCASFGSQHRHLPRISGCGQNRTPEDPRRPYHQVTLADAAQTGSGQQAAGSRQRAAGSSKGAVPPPIEFGYCASVLSATQDFRTLAAAPPSIAASARARANFMRSRRVPELDLS